MSKSQIAGTPRKLDTIGNRLRHMRTKRGWTIYDVEHFAGIPAPTLAEYERDLSIVPADRLPVLARLLSVSVEWLVTGKETAENLRRQWPEGFALWGKLSRELNDADKERVVAFVEAFLKQRDKVSQIIDWDRLEALGVGDGAPEEGNPSSEASGI